MLFSQLIEALKQGDSELKEFNILKDPEILQGASIDKAHSNQISFLEKGSPLISALSETKTSAVLLPDQQNLKHIAESRNISWALLENPRLAFAESLDLLFPKLYPKQGIHTTAVIGNHVTIGEGVSIGPNVCIADNCTIGTNSIIHPGVVIYEEVEIGENNELHANCVLHRKSRLGKNCIIHSNSVIGSEGFGFVPTKTGWRKMPQTGYVILEEEVEIGCSTSIDRPSVGVTKIGAGTKIDNLVQIGHGVTTGQNCAMASQVGIAGGASIGNGVILAGQVGVGNRVNVGNGVIASSKCGIHSDIDDNNVVSGFPAMPNRLWLRCSANFKKLPEIAKSLRQLNNQTTKK